jgi:hypothetical protein
MLDSPWERTATLLSDGRVLLAGGSGGDRGEQIDRAETFDPQSDLWTKTGSMIHRREFHGAARLPGGPVLVAGGYSSNERASYETELYEPAAGLWNFAGELAIGRSNQAMARLNGGLVLVAGGCDGRPCADAEVYTPRGAPQRPNLVERAYLPLSLRGKPLPEACRTS